MTAHKEWFATLKPLEEGKITIRFGNGDLVSAKGIGQIKIFGKRTTNTH